MSSAALLASRLRQAIQGCTLHLHGPVQAWQAIAQASRAGQVDAVEVATLAIAACRLRLQALARDGVAADDPRVRKEASTVDFIAALFSLSDTARGQD